MEKVVGEPKDENNEESVVAEDLEQQKNWSGIPMCLYQGFWCPTIFFRPMLSFRKNFKARDTDILFGAQLESGYTWMKALLFSIVNRHVINPSPLLSNTLNTLVPNLESSLFPDDSHSRPDIETMASPRLFSTHLPYHLLSTNSVINSNSKIIYISRNPLDQFVSEREYILKAGSGHDSPVEEALDLFCRGAHIFGPFWDNILGYWKASRENPRRVLFLKYEEVKMDPMSYIGKIAEFLEMPFSDEERKRGSIEEITNLCSSFDTTCEIGAWKNCLTPAMVEKLKETIDAKMTAFGFKV